MKAIKKVCVEKLRITRESFFAFVVCMCVGLFTHAYMLLNKIPFYDDIAHLYDVASTVSCGRWFLGILGKCVDIVFGRNISIPFINGVLSLIFISISACVFVRCFRIKNLYNIGFIACLFSAFPVVTSIFGYMFTAPYYFLALCLSILSIYVVDKKYGVFWSVAFLALSLGIYQSFFCVAIIMSILMVMLQAKKECTEKELVIYTIRYLISLVGAIVIYFIMHKLSVMVTGIQMLNYQGVENMGELSLQSLISGTLLAYKQFLLMFMDDYRGVSSLPIIRIGMIFSAVFFVYLSIISLKTTKKVFNKIVYFLCVCLVPLGINSIYLMVDARETIVHTLMIYSVVFVFILPIVLLEQDDDCINELKKGCKKAIIYINNFVLGLVICGYIYVNNAAYFNVDLVQSQVDSYCTILLTQIKSTPGYTDDMQICIVQDKEKSGIFDFNDQTMNLKNEFGFVQMNPYGITMRNWLRDYSFPYYLQHRMGYNIDKLELYDGSYQVEEIKMMPCYPDYGSIAIFEDKVLVKLSEYE